jgi:hypothetical protein
VYQLSIAQGPRKNTKNLDQVDRPQDLPDANYLLDSRPAFDARGLALLFPVCAAPLLSKNVYKTFYKEMFVYKFCLQIFM